MDYGTVTERVNRGVRVLAEHGIQLTQLDAVRFAITNPDDCALGQAYDILYPGENPGFYGGYKVLRDQWSQESDADMDATQWANFNGFSLSLIRVMEFPSLNAEWKRRIRDAQRSL